MAYAKTLPAQRPARAVRVLPLLLGLVVICLLLSLFALRIAGRDHGAGSAAPARGSRAAAAPPAPRGAPAAPPELAGDLSRLAQAGVAGTVYSTDGRALAGALISAAGFELVGNIPAPAGTTRSDPAGRFALTLPEGTYQISASLAGYGSTSAPARTGERISLVLARSGVIRGRVLSERREPVREFAIDVLSVTPGNMAAPAPLWSRRVASADGSFQVDQLPSWAVLIKASAAGRAAAFSAPLWLRAGEERAVELILRPGCAISGTVEDRRGQRQAFVLVDAEARIGAGTGSGVSADSGNQTQSDAEGRFRLDHVPAGPALLRAYDEGHAVTTVRLDVDQGCATAPVRVVLGDGATLRGVARGADGRPLPGARLTVSQRAIGFLTTRSDAEGRYRFERLPAGRVRLELHHQGQRTLAVANIPESGAVERDVALMEPGNAELRGVVVAGGRRLPGVQLLVGAMHPGKGIDTYYPVTDEAGAFALRGLPQGSYLVHVQSTSATQRVTLAPGGVGTVALDVAVVREPPKDDRSEPETTEARAQTVPERQGG